MSQPKTKEYIKREEELKRFLKNNGLWDSVRELEEGEEEEEPMTHDDWRELHDIGRDR